MLWRLPSLTEWELTVVAPPDEAVDACRLPSSDHCGYGIRAITTGTGHYIPQLSGLLKSSSVISSMRLCTDRYAMVMPVAIVSTERRMNHLDLVILDASSFLSVCQTSLRRMEGRGLSLSSRNRCQRLDTATSEVLHRSRSFLSGSWRVRKIGRAHV